MSTHRTGLRTLPVIAAFLFNVLAPVFTVAAPAVLGPVNRVIPFAAAAGDPSHVGFTLEGCRNPSVALPNGNGFVCADGDYTTGNLGKTWNELDLVPHRLIATAGTSAPSSQSYTIGIAADSMDGGHPGYDVLTMPVINAAESDPSCQLSAGNQQTISPGVGGTDESIGRLLTITQNQSTTCVIDWAERLALGSHLFPGSSLHTNRTNSQWSTSGIGAADVSIPVNQILPQELSKTMSAFQGTAYAWSVNKTANPTSLTFGNTCEVTEGARSASVQVTVSWTRSGPSPSGATTVTTVIKATNPAHRTITVNVTDRIYAGSTQSTLLDTSNSGNVNVAPNTTAIVLTHSFVYSGLATSFNDVATASYVDLDTGIPVPGNTTATASATTQPSTAPASNASAVISDTESISGAGLSFSVAAPSLGAFSNYTAGASTTGPVDWSYTAGGSGSVTFTKTVSVAGPTNTSGSLDDTATATSVDGGTTFSSKSLSVPISASASVSLTISKTIPNVLSAQETASFTFDISGPNAYSAKRTLSFSAGETSKSVTITGLQPGTYTVSEEPADGWNSQQPQQVNLSLPVCAATASFTNTFSPAHARVQKVTVPAGSEAGWTFYLNGPGASNVAVTSGGSGYTTFPTDLQEGSFTITEQPQNGWNQTNASGCSFTVDYPLDSGKTFSCVITNTKVGIAIQKTNDDADGIVTRGQKIHYTITVTITNGPADNVVVTDVIPDGLTFVADSETPTGGFSHNGQNLQWGVGTLASGTYTYAYDATVNPDAADSQTNHACVDSSDLLASPGPKPLCAETTVTVTPPSVSIVKTNNAAQDGSVLPGETINYDLKVTVANGPAHDVVVTDTIPAGLTYKQGTAAPSGGFTSSGQDLEWQAGTLASGTYHFTYSVTVDGNAAGSLTNLGCVAASDDASQAPICDDTTVHVLPSVSIVKVNNANGPVVRGDTVHYTLTVTVSNGPAHDVVVSDTLPNGLTYKASSANPASGFSAGDGQHLSWAVGTLATGTHTYQYDATVGDSAAGTLENVGCVAASDDAVNDQTNPICDNSTVEVTPPTVSIVKVNNAEGTVTRGSTVHYTLTVTITDGPAHDIVVTDTLPAGVIYKAGTADPSAGFSAGDGQHLSWNVGSLATGSHTFSYDGLVADNAPVNSEITNIGCVAASDDANTDDAGNPICDTSTIEVTPPEIQINKTSNYDGKTVTRGQTIDYSLTVTVNNGPMHNAVVTDTLPAGLTYLASSASPAPFSVVGQVITWKFATLASGDHAITYQATVDTTASGTLANLGCVKTDEQQDELCDQTTSNVTPPTITIVKENNADGPVTRGSEVHYTLTVTVSNGPAHDVVVTDTLPNGLAYKASSADPAGGFTALDSQHLRWDAGTLTDGTYTYQYDAVVGDSAAGTLENVGCVAASDDTNVDDAGHPICDTTDISVTPPLVSIVKVNNADAPLARGASVTYTLTVSVANGPAHDVMVTDTLPAGLTYTTGTADPSTGFSALDGRHLQWDAGTLATGTYQFSYQATVDDTAAIGTELVNTGCVAASDIVSETPVCDESQVEVKAPALTIAKSADTDEVHFVFHADGSLKSVTPADGKVTWTLTYTLTDGPVHNAVITDPLPEYLNFVSASDGGTYANRTITWNLGTLTASGSVTFVTTVDPAAPETGPIVNVAAIRSDETPESSAQASVRVTSEQVEAATSTPKASVPNTALAYGPSGQPIQIPVELLVVLFIGSLGGLTFANVRAVRRRR
jgi:fimbrial isopeptide formation D2 family protein/uncharacterized repeat protein (TIGR01451 family)